MGNRKAFLYGGLVLAAAAAALFFLRSWYVSLFAVCAGTLLASFALFEDRAAAVEKTVLTAVLSTAAAAGRALFAAFPPGVQPASFIIILTGTVFGPEAGFVTGALTALISSLVLGMGPWTVWQMLAWGLMGFAAGLLRVPMRGSKAFRVVFSFLWGILFGWIMNIWSLVSMGSGSGLVYVLTIYGASLLFDVFHGATNALLMFFAGDRIIRMLGRVAAKYGLIRM
ncbi:MAG: ECF transporter S component [Firmicutes bacterium]|nr:ECF transporter S component [Bacillota bacterium]